MRRTLVAAGLALAIGAWAAAGAWGGRPGAWAQGFASRTDQAEFLPGFRAQGEVLYVVAIGSDARPGVCEPVERCLGDSIHLIGINASQRAASILGIPRDSYVDIPGHGQGKINDALFLGGPELVVDTVEQLAGVEVDHHFLTSFEGFRHMIEEIGGIAVEIPYPMSDASSGAVFPAGPAVLDGKQALAFARNRKDVPNGDFSRTENQGLLMLAALSQFRREVRKDPLRLFTWLIAGKRYIITDLSLVELFDLALATMTINPEKVVNRAVPGGIGLAGAASIVTLGGEADAVFADIADDGVLESPGPTEDA
ncbi:MAG TPA: LCP family protein [Actinomycetota bacterium]|nr:LCP family protein [Actinomycetota bacterium]